MKKKALKQKMNLLTKKLCEVLRSTAKLPTQVVKNTPFVPAGYYTPEHQVLPDGTHWFSSFWAACFTRVRDAGKPAVINGCLDMFEIENEKSELQTSQYEPQSSATPYPMPVLHHSNDPTYSYYQPLMPGNRRAIPMGIRIPNEPSFQMIPQLVRGLVGDDISGTLISAFTELSVGLLQVYLQAMDSDDDFD